ncbi:unannotated protein [freshwater metagenome]|jgi:LysM repeat protein|uniref:Unannotated protein n=1 Tax=freshwater metagenome TaxID=449393 RepID=A0A6J6SIN5_9ZZZZ|nr:hypothetical protein [Actinomycetota bacterium]MSV93779.1 hypothetical protein [Actinomycetota bacterium]MSW60302.1 hypothetical protein [Actinomycetota bacterium]MSY45540.1 hypothetical protein [Actinomycetota bacterium]
MRSTSKALRRSALLTVLVASSVGLPPAAPALADTENPDSSSVSDSPDAPVEVTPEVPLVRSGRSETNLDPALGETPVEIPKAEPPQSNPETTEASGTIRSGRDARENTETKKSLPNDNKLEKENAASPVIPIPKLPATESEPITSPPSPLAIQAPTPVSYTVIAGDNLWSISAAHLNKIWGRPATIAEVGSYWDRVCTINQPRLSSGNISLIYSGEVIELPNL